MLELIIRHRWAKLPAYQKWLLGKKREMQKLAFKMLMTLQFAK